MELEQRQLDKTLVGWASLPAALVGWASLPAKTYSLRNRYNFGRQAWGAKLDFVLPFSVSFQFP